MRLEWQTTPGTPRVGLVDRRGQTLSPGAALTHAVDPASGIFSVELHIAALAEGDYAIEVSAGQGENADQQIVAFRVGR
jgi:hypothetical protein